MKAQMKIQQTAFLLIAVTLFFALVGMVVLGFKISSVKGTATALQEKNAMLLATKLANSPEFSCGEAFGFGIKKIACVDADKVMALKDFEKDYFGFWGVIKIEVRKIYPIIEEDIKCNFSNYPECNLIEIRAKAKTKDYITVSNFVSLCRKESFNNRAYDKCELAKLMVSYEKIT